MTQPLFHSYSLVYVSEALNLKPNIIRALWDAGIRYVEQLHYYTPTQIKALPGIGNKTMTVLKEELFWKTRMELGCKASHYKTDADVPVIHATKIPYGCIAGCIPYYTVIDKGGLVCKCTDNRALVEGYLSREDVRYTRKDLTEFFIQVDGMRFGTTILAVWDIEVDGWKLFDITGLGYEEPAQIQRMVLCYLDDGDRPVWLP